jgi:hypothetical protein
VKTLYLDAFSGISGDMMLGALADLGVPLEVYRRTAETLGLQEVDIEAGRTERRGIGGVKVNVRDRAHGVVRTYAHVRDLIEDSSLPRSVKEKSLQVFGILAEAESRIHSRDIEKVHFHELSSVDTMVDVVGSIAGLAYLEVEEVISSPLPLGTGRIKTAHGIYPIPVPAVAEILKDVPVYSTGIPTELVTPTGAALVKALASDFGLLPAMRLEKVGYGAGERDLEMPNLLRVFLGERTASLSGAALERRLVISANIDDMNPELFPYVMEKLFDRGAEDVWLTPIQMKKSRPAVTLNALVPPSRREEVKRVFFEETKTLGLRITEVEKEFVPRETVTVTTPYGPVKVKVAWSEGRPVNVAPEYEDCRKAAEERGVPLKEVYAAAEEGAREYLFRKGPERS